MGLITKKIMEYIYRRKLNFMLIVVVMAIAGYMLFMVVEMYFKSVYHIYDTKSQFAENSFVNLKILMNENKTDYHGSVEKYLEKLREEYGDDFGTFMYMQVRYYVSGEDREEDTLYIDENLFNLCKLTIHEEIPSGEYIKGYVCRNRLSEYPVGTILENVHTGTKTIIAGYFDAGSKWVADLLFHSSSSTVLLDGYIVSAMDQSYFNISNQFYSNVFNSVYVRSDGTQTLAAIKNDLRTMADTYGIDSYAYTLEELIDREKSENKELMESIGGLILFAVLIAMTGILSACMADTLSRHYEITVMSVNGVSPVDIYLMMFFENCIKAALSFSCAVYFYGRGVWGAEGWIFYRLVIPTVGVGVLIFILIVTTLSYRSVNQNKLLKLMGGEHL